MAAHPAGKGKLPAFASEKEVEEHRRDNQLGMARLLAEIDKVLEPLDPFVDAAGEVYAELLDLLVSKQADYGPHAISRSPGGALVGINVRMHDKMQRAQHLRREGGAPNHESLRDTYRDLANYAVIALMVIDGTWPA